MSGSTALDVTAAELAEACKRPRAPVPARGFWARKATGREGKQAIFVEVADPALNTIERVAECGAGCAGADPRAA